MRLATIICLAMLLSGISPSSVLAGKNSAKTLGKVTHPAYLKECGACHFAFQPQLLPKRSWERIMGSLDKHFGDSTSLDEATRTDIMNYLAGNSAEASSSRLSGKILASIGKNETPVRITDTQYFKRKHREVRAGVFKRKSIGSASNCAGCHMTAEKGDFEEHNVKIPKN